MKVKTTQNRNFKQNPANSTTFYHTHLLSDAAQAHLPRDGVGHCRLGPPLLVTRQTKPLLTTSATDQFAQLLQFKFSLCCDSKFCQAQNKIKIPLEISIMLLRCHCEISPNFLCRHMVV